MNTLTDHLDAILDHLAVHQLPRAASISVRAYDDFAVVVQLDSGRLAHLAGDLLTWAATLEDCAFSAWRVPAGHNVHVDLSGRLASGTGVKVYGGITFDPAVFPDMEPNGRQSVGLSVLRVWASTGVGVAA